MTTQNEMTPAKDAVALVARVLLAAMFVIAGFGKIGGFEGTAGYIASKGLPLPQLGAAIAIVVELAGGILLIVGWKARWAALAIAAFTAVATVLAALRITNSHAASLPLAATGYTATPCLRSASKAARARRPCRACC